MQLRQEKEKDEEKESEIIRQREAEMDTEELPGLLAACLFLLLIPFRF